MQWQWSLVYVVLMWLTGFSLGAPKEWGPNVRGTDEATVRKWIADGKDASPLKAPLLQMRKSLFSKIPIRFLVYGGGSTLDLAFVVAIQNDGSIELYWAPFSSFNQTRLSLQTVPCTSVGGFSGPWDSDELPPEFLAHTRSVERGIAIPGRTPFEVSLKNVISFTWDGQNSYEFSLPHAPESLSLRLEGNQEFSLRKELSQKLSEEVFHGRVIIEREPAPSLMTPLYLFEEYAGENAQYYLLSAEHEMSKFSSQTLYRLEFIDPNGSIRTLVTTARSFSFGKTVQVSFPVKAGPFESESATLEVVSGNEPKATLKRNNDTSLKLEFVASGVRQIEAVLNRLGVPLASARTDLARPKCLSEILSAARNTLTQPL